MGGAAPIPDGIGAPLRALVLAEAVPPLLSDTLDRTRRISAECMTPPSWKDCIRLGIAKSHDVAVIVPTRRTVLCAILLRQFGWRLVLLTGLPGTDSRAARLAVPFADAVFDVPVTRPDGCAADRFAAIAAEAAGRPGAGLTSGPAVSVIATVLNEERSIDQLMRQVSKQLRPGDEFVIVDGGSRDSTLGRIEAFRSADDSIRWISAAGTNIPAGRNAGIREARNSIIVTTDADCELSPDWLEALRRPFAEQHPPGLVAGNCAVEATRPIEQAQALACYADPRDSRFPTLLVRVHGRLFGGRFDPTLPFARSLAFTKEAWDLVGGFPERLYWVEDGVFGRNIAQHRRCVFAADAIVTWRQRNSLTATVCMYLTYGRGAAKSGDRQLVRRDMVRFLAYIGSLAAISRGRRGLLAVSAGGLAYCSLPLTRAVRYRTGLASALCIPVALAAKDLGKVGGAVSARLIRAEDRRSQWPPWKLPEAPGRPHGAAPARWRLTDCRPRPAVRAVRRWPCGRRGRRA